MITRFTSLALWLLCVGLIAGLTVPVFAQSVISGELTGTVTDASGAVVTNATITLTNKEMAVNQTTTSGSAGSFRFPLLRPGTYTIKVVAKGFSTAETVATASLGQITSVPIQLKVGAASETVEVTAAAPLLQTESANLVTTYNTAQVEFTPNPGQDISTFALAAPGAVLSTGAGYGNYTSFGLPGTSNLYTINGGDMNDPYNNLNNSGSSNNMLGTNEIQELTIVNNGYTGQYGRLGGTQVDITTKSGSNSFHGNGRWDFNSSGFNGNEWFNKQAGNVTPHMVSNQWAGSFGGPAIKDKLFFFFDSEGLRYVLPGAVGTPVYIPTTAFANYVKATVPAAQVPFYTNIFNLYAGAAGATGAKPVTLSDDSSGAFGCGNFAGTAGFGTAATPCAAVFHSGAGSLNIERLMAIRVDLVASKKDNVNWRYWQDRGTQATGTDPINNAFSANSNQPQDAGNMSWTHTFSPTVVNQLVAGGFYYSAIFGPPNLAGAISTFPYELDFADGLFTSLGGSDAIYPQGRNIAQYQIVDDVSWTRGNHGFKFGVNFRRNNLNEFALGAGTTGDYIINDMNDFVNGSLAFTGSSTYAQAFPSVRHQEESLYSLGLYGQDEWRVTPKLKLTMALRVDRNSDIHCKASCYSEFNGGFYGISHALTTPYNQSIVTGLGKAFPSVQRVSWQPRLGFAYQLKPNMVVRGGIGLFNDLYPASLGARFITNAPNDPSFTVSSGTIDAPGVAASASAQAAAVAAAFKSAYAANGTFGSISAALAPIPFTPPNFNDPPQQLLNPRWTEWNLEVQRELGTKNVVKVNYVGNHGSDLFVQNRGFNAYFNNFKLTDANGVKTAFPTFGDLPTAPLDARFRRVIGVTNNGISNYDGVTTSFTRRVSQGFTGTVNYTYSHTLDDVSNGGIYPYAGLNFNNDGTGLSGDSLRYQLDPLNLKRLNYSNADYDFRHNLSANFVWQLPFKSSSSALLDRIIGGWQVSGVYFWRSREPYSVIRTNLASSTWGYSTSPILAQFLGGGMPTCNYPTTGGAATQCLSGSQFAGSALSPPGFLYQDNFGNIPRNSFRGPRFSDGDLSVLKSFKTTERGPVLTFGANAFNVFNHPNFANPMGILNNGAFGTIISTVGPSSSPYGNFQGFASGRIVQMEAKVTF